MRLMIYTICQQNEEECVASCRDGEYLDSATHKCAFCIASMVFLFVNYNNAKKSNCIKCSASNVCEECSGTNYVKTTNDGCIASCAITNYLKTKCVGDCVADDNAYLSISTDKCVKGRNIKIIMIKKIVGRMNKNI